MEDKELREYLSKIKISDEEMLEHINSALDVAGEVPKDFSCNICLGLVYDATECNQCNQLFCRKHFTDWKATKWNAECPICREVIKDIKKINNILKRYLDETMLKGCPI